MNFVQQPPTSQDELLAALYRGVIFHAPHNPTSTALVKMLHADLLCTFPEVSEASELPRVQHLLTPELFFERITTLRAQLAEAPRIQRQLHAVMMSMGCSPNDHAVDVLRLRAVPHEGHLIEAAAAAYYAHRDTWYGNPQAQINWWIPLFDVTPETSFGLFPHVFSQAVVNDSEKFDYATFMQAVGWQNYNPGPKPTYPRALTLPGAPQTFAMKRGEILLFSAAHLHTTMPNTSGLTRFSVDFRSVHRTHHKRGTGAPNVDNNSTGSAFEDYLVPSALTR